MRGHPVPKTYTPHGYNINIQVRILTPNGDEKELVKDRPEI